MKKLILFLFTIIISSHIIAQDKIHKKNGQIVKAKVIEVGTSEIKYKIFNDAESPIYVLDRDNVTKIEYENGKIEKFTPSLTDPELYEGQLRRAIKIDFLGPMLGYSQITYEKSTGVGKAYEITLGIIGAGKNQVINNYFSNDFRFKKRNQFGLAAAIGYKFNKFPDFLFGRTKFKHIMQGAYVKPIIYAGNYSENRVIYKQNEPPALVRRNTSFGALQIELGKQTVYANKFVFDYYIGFGYGFDNKKQDRDDNDYSYSDNTSAYNYINARAGRSPGFSVTYGAKIGMLLKDEKKKPVEEEKQLH